VVFPAGAVVAGYVAEREVSFDTVLYVITDRGRKALADAKKVVPCPEQRRGGARPRVSMRRTAWLGW
jgi:hypothetical protein